MTEGDVGCRRRDLTDEAPASQAYALPAGSPA